MAGAHLRPQDAKKMWKTFNLILNNIHNNYSETPFYIFVDANINLLDVSNQKFVEDIDQEKFQLVFNSSPTRKGYGHQTNTITDYFIISKNSHAQNTKLNIIQTYTLSDHNLLELRMSITNKLGQKIRVSQIQVPDRPQMELNTRLFIN